MEAIGFKSAKTLIKVISRVCVDRSTNSSNANNSRNVTSTGTNNNNNANNANYFAPDFFNIKHYGPMLVLSKETKTSAV